MILTANTAKEVSLIEIGELIHSVTSILVLAHYRPDGDAIGSSIALTSVLRELGKEVTCCNKDEVPEYLRFLESEECSVSLITEPISVDLCIALDCATIERLGEEVIDRISAQHTLTIDHHVTNEKYGDSLLLDCKAAATGEIIYQLIQENNFPMPDQARDALYVAISTDTGSLQYSNSSEKTYRTMADLVGRGADVARLNAQTYFNHSQRRVEILRECLKSFSLSDDGQVSYWTVSYAAQEAVGVQVGDMEGLMDLLRGINGVRVCFTLEESASGVVRLSMRSKDEAVDVSKICGCFGGGGHRMAAGAGIKDVPFEKCAKLVLAKVKEAL